MLRRDCYRLYRLYIYTYTGTGAAASLAPLLRNRSNRTRNFEESKFVFIFIAGTWFYQGRFDPKRGRFCSFCLLSGLSLAQRERGAFHLSKPFQYMWTREKLREP